MNRRLVRGLVVTALVFAACFSVILGLLLLSDRGLLTMGAGRVALVEVEGLIVDADRVVRELEEHGEDPTIRAVVVRIQSPGGVVAPTQEIYDAIQRLRERHKKKVVASMGAVAASGGYYLAVASDHIYASPGTLTGSIGVLIQLTEIEGLLKKVGVRYEVIKAGRFKDAGNFSRPMTDAERAVLQGLIDDMYDQFVTAVAKGRKLDRKTVEALADGRVYSGRRAKELGLIDELGGMEDAVLKAGNLAGIPGKPKLVRPRRPFHLTDLLEWVGGQTPLSALLVSRSALGSLPLLGVTKLPLYLME